MAVLACPAPAERDRLLHSECGSNTTLREAVESLLNESSEMGDFLERPAVSDTRVTSSETPLSPLLSGENIGDQIGPYRLIDFVGEGGGGSVYLAEQSSPVQRTLALKILKLGLDTRSFTARFEAERQTLAMMEHPNIAKVLDAGATKEGRPYFVMDYVSGAPITEYCDANRLPIDARIRIFIKVCRAVEHAHQKGIIHRDLKPSNILVSDQEGEAVPKIIDFGVAKAIDPSAEGQRLTQLETVIGTPAYMSPEQVEHSPEGVDTRSDIYALGVLLHELLTGYTPLEADGVDQNNIVEVRKAMATSKPTRPSLKVRQTAPDVIPAILFDRATNSERLVSSLRGDLDWIILKCLESDRTRRFGSATELSMDLERYLAAEPITARPPSATYRLGKFVRRNRSAVAAACGLLILLIAASAISTALAVRATRAERETRGANSKLANIRDQALHDREQALRSAATAHLHEYVADINVSNKALEDGNIAKALHLLDRQSAPFPGRRDLRGFEWRLLAGRCFGDRHQSLPTQERPISAIAFSREGDLLAIGTSESGFVWSLSDERSVLDLGGGISGLAFTAQRQLAVASRRGITIHELDAIEPSRTLSERGSALAISPNGDLLATTGRRGVSVWDTKTWARLHHRPFTSGPLAFSPDGKALALGTREGISIWLMEQGTPSVTLDDSSSSYRSRIPGGSRLAFSPDGAFVISPQNLNPTPFGYALGIWSVATGREVAMLPSEAGDGAHAGLISALSMENKSGLLATSSWDHSLRLWDFGSRGLIRTLHGHRSEVWCVALSAQGDLIASGSKNGEVMIWPTASPAANDTIEGRWKPLKFSPDSNFLAALNRSGTLSIFNMNTLEPARSINLSSTDSRFGRHAVSLSQDLNILAEGRSDGSVRIKNLSQQSERTLKVGRRRVDYLAISPNATTLLTRGWQEDLVWREIETGKAFATIAGSEAVFSIDGSALVAIDREGHATVWDTASRTERVRIAHGSQSTGSRVAISDDGATIAMTHGYDDFENAISLWDSFSGKRLGTLTGHKQVIWSLRFSPDGQTLVSSSGGGSLRFWNIESRRELLTLREAGKNLTDLVFSPDGQYLVGGSPAFTAKARLSILSAPAVEDRIEDRERSIEFPGSASRP